jgi:signal transduction histidine kinase
MDIRNKILIVDDRKENIAALVTLLEDMNVQIFPAGSGNEALALTLEHDFALALIDVQMPDMDGYETLRLMRKVEKTRFLPVIFLSAIYSEDHFKIQGIEAGAVDFITKPFNPRVLLGKVKVFLDLYNQRKLLETEIEQRKLAEAQLREAKLKAEESDRLKSAFLSNMSHEIRTPLTTIVGMAGLLAAKDYPPEKKKEISEHIDRSSEGLLTIINDILDLSKIEAGEIKIQNEPVDLKRLFRELESTFGNKLKRNNKTGIELRIKIPDDTGIYPVTDKNRLRQILSNLLGNALKFTSTGYIEAGYSKKNGFIEFYVEDTGAGIPEDKFHLIFERFQKLHDHSTGTGLGLPIVKKLVELLNGEIHVESEVGKGSKFIFTIPYSGIGPVKDEPAEEVKETSEFTRDLSSKSILIAEDEYPIYFLLQTILAPSKINITWARDGREALDSFKSSGNFDAVLLDIKMPVMDGIETFRELRKIDNDVPVIAQTAFVMNDEREMLKNMGFNGFITKPFVRKEIMQVIDAFIH